VRGDTFVIRGYGEARDATGNNVLARSWCEAVVQRVPDYLDSSDKAHEHRSMKSKVNRTFGRRFNIISFRYLHSREISFETIDRTQHPRHVSPIDRRSNSRLFLRWPCPRRGVFRAWC
jgi:hypothetical protein